MHYRGVDWHGVVHYVDKVWRAEVAGHLFAPWCLSGQAKNEVRLEDCLLVSAHPRNQIVTCLACWYLRLGARRGG